MKRWEDKSLLFIYLFIIDLFLFTSISNRRARFTGIRAEEINLQHKNKQKLFDVVFRKVSKLPALHLSLFFFIHLLQQQKKREKKRLLFFRPADDDDLVRRCACRVFWCRLSSERGSTYRWFGRTDDYWKISAANMWSSASECSLCDPMDAESHSTSAESAIADLLKCRCHFAFSRLFLVFSYLLPSISAAFTSEAGTPLCKNRRLRTAVFSQRQLAADRVQLGRAASPSIYCLWCFPRCYYWWKPCPSKSSPHQLGSHFALAS